MKKYIILFGLIFAAQLSHASGDAFLDKTMERLQSELGVCWMANNKKKIKSQYDQHKKTSQFTYHEEEFLLTDAIIRLNTSKQFKIQKLQEMRRKKLQELRQHEDELRKNDTIFGEMQHFVAKTKMQCFAIDCGFGLEEAKTLEQERNQKF